MAALGKQYVPEVWREEALQMCLERYPRHHLGTA